MRETPSKKLDLQLNEDDQLLSQLRHELNNENFIPSDEMFLSERKESMKRATRNKISRSLKGKTVPRSVRKKISDTMKGHSNFEGNHHDPDTKRELRRERGHDDRVRGRKWRTEVRTGEESRVYRLGNSKKYRWGRALSEWLAEAKNTQTNKLSAIDTVERAYHDAEPLNSLDVINAFVAASDTEKLIFTTQGSSADSTLLPAGIYAQPAEYILRQVEQNGGSEKLQGIIPLSPTPKYVTVFSVSGNIIDLSSISSDQVDRYISKLAKVTQQFNSSITVDEAQHQVDSFVGANTDEEPGWLLWNVLQTAATKFLRQSEQSKTLAKVYKELGIDGVYDNGDAIINSAEPYQLVIFSRSGVSKEQRVANKPVDRSTSHGEITGSLHKDFERRVERAGTGETFEHLVKTEVFSQPELASGIVDSHQQRKLLYMCDNSNVVEIVSNMTSILSDDLLVKAVRLNSKVLRLLERPSRSLIVAVGTSNPAALAEINAKVSPERLQSVMSEHPNFTRYLPTRFKTYFETNR